MTKAIKFNLILDGNPVRNLDELRNNFNVEDILESYRNGSLKRWLDTRDLANESAELDRISGDDINAALELCRIFQADCTKEQLKQAAYPFEFRQKEAAQLQQYKDFKKQKNEIINAYHDSYDKLLLELDEKGSDYSYVKPALAWLYENHPALYQIDAEAFYGRYIKKHPLVILAMLANKDMRPLLARSPDKIYSDLDFMQLIKSHILKSEVDAFLDKWKADKEQPGVSVIKNLKECASLIEKNILMLILNYPSNKEDNGTILYSSMLNKTAYPLAYIPCENISSKKNYVKTFADETQTHWKDIIPKGKRVLIIKMESGNLLRNCGNHGEELKEEDVNGKFLILNGMEYKSNNASDQLIYMEV